MKINIVSLATGYLKFQLIPITAVGVFFNILSWLTRFGYVEIKDPNFFLFFENPLVWALLLIMSFFYIHVFYKDRLCLKYETRRREIVHYLASMTIGLVAATIPYLMNQITLFIYTLNENFYIPLNNELWKLPIVTFGFTFIVTDMFRSMDGKSGWVFYMHNGKPKWLSYFLNYIKKLSKKEQILFFTIIGVGIIVSYTSSQTVLDYREIYFPNEGIGLAHGENILVYGLQFNFVTTVEPQYVSITVVPSFKNYSKPSYFAIELPYEGYLIDPSGGWNSAKLDNSMLLYKKYDCSVDKPCSIPRDGQELIDFDLKKKLDSKEIFEHSIQLRFRNHPSNDAMNYVYDNLIKDNLQPIYDIKQLSGTPVVKLTVDTDAEQTSIPPQYKTEVFYNKYGNYKNKSWVFNLTNNDSFLEARYDIPVERNLKTVLDYSIIPETLLIGVFIAVRLAKKDRTTKFEEKTFNDDISSLKEYISTYSNKIKTVLIDSIRTTVNGESVTIRIEPAYVDNVLEFINSNRNCWIVGERGVGKSALCKKIFETLDTEGKIVLLLRADDILSSKSFDDITKEETGTTLLKLVDKITKNNSLDFYLIVDSVENIARNETIWTDFSTNLSMLQSNDKVHTILTIRDSDFKVFPERFPPNWGVEYALSGFTNEQISEVLTKLQIKEKVSQTLYPILAKPFYLFVLSEIVKRNGITDYSTITNHSHFFQLHYDLIVRKNDKDATGKKKIQQLKEIALEMLKQEQLKISKNQFTSKAYRTLCTNGVLVEDVHNVQFVHDMYFDFVTCLRIEEEGLIKFLEKHGTSYFLKSTINFMFGYLKSKNNDQYLADVQSILESTTISEYWKLEVLEFLSTLLSVTQEEGDLLSGILNTDKTLRLPFLRYLIKNKNPVWFNLWAGTVLTEWSTDESCQMELVEYVEASMGGTG